MIMLQAVGIVLAATYLTCGVAAWAASLSFGDVSQHTWLDHIALFLIAVFLWFPILLMGGRLRW